MRRLIIAVALAAFFAAGCGGKGDDASKIDAHEPATLRTIEAQILNNVNAKLNVDPLLAEETTPHVDCIATTAVHAECVVRIEDLMNGMDETNSWEVDVDPKTGQFAAHSR